MSWYRKKKTHSQWLNFFFLGWLFTWKLGPSYWGRTFGLPNLDRRRKQLFFFITFFSAVPISPLFFIARAKRTRTKTKKKKTGLDKVHARQEHMDLFQCPAFFFLQVSINYNVERNDVVQSNWLFSSLAQIGQSETLERIISFFFFFFELGTTTNLKNKSDETNFKPE